MSPLISARPDIDPSQLPSSRLARGGTTSATGTPNRVTRTGRPVRLTRRNTARQVALNSEAAIVSNSGLLLILLDHRQLSFMIQGLRDQIASLQHSVNFRLEALASELRIRDRDARAQTRRLRASNDELRDRVQALTSAPVNPLG